MRTIRKYGLHPHSRIFEFLISTNDVTIGTWHMDLLQVSKWDRRKAPYSGILSLEIQNKLKINFSTLISGDVVYTTQKYRVTVKLATVVTAPLQKGRNWYTDLFQATQRAVPSIFYKLGFNPSYWTWSAWRRSVALEHSGCRPNSRNNMRAVSNTKDMTTKIMLRTNSISL